MAQRRPIVARSLLALLGCVAGLGLGEVLVRVTGAAPEVGFFRKEQFQISPNVRIGWEPVPNPASTGGTQNPRWTADQRNSLGYRDYEHSVEKVPGICRIAVLGDSIAKGLGVDAPEGTYPGVIERKLREFGVPSEVMNFGVEGYNTQQEVETLKDKGMRYSPDLVVLAYVLNDRDWPAHHLYRELLEEEAGSGGVSAARLSPILARSALYRFLRFRLLDRPPGAEGAGDARIRSLIDLVQRDTVEEYFGVLRDLSKERGFRVLVVVFPYLDDLANYRHMDQHRWVRDLSAREGFDHLDLLDTFVRCQRLAKESIAIDEVHPTFVGLYCAGYETATYIKEKGLAGPRPGGR